MNKPQSQLITEMFSCIEKGKEEFFADCLKQFMQNIQNRYILTRIDEEIERLENKFNSTLPPDLTA
jgi:retron-type reverse transcriptase